jgi:predicted oxidoreductase
MTYNADAIIVGAGLAGLAAAAELVDAKKNIIILDQEPEQSLGGQAFWSFGGLFFVNSPEQRRMGIRDSYELAHQDWMGTAAFDRPEDKYPRLWAEAYLDFATNEKYEWLKKQGLKLFPVVGWAERGGYTATGHGNSVPRFHVTWGTGPGVLEPFIRRVQKGVEQGLVRYCFRHRVTELIKTNGTVTGVSGEILENSLVERGAPSTRNIIGEFSFHAPSTIITTGGIGGNHDLVRQNWPARMGTPPKKMIQGVPDHVDGLMLGIVERNGGNLINRDRMWHYPEGVQNYAPIWNRHAIRILSGPSPLWMDACGKRLPTPLFPGFDTIGSLEYITKTGYDYSWFVLTQKMIEKEFVLSGSEQNPDLTNRSIRLLMKRILPGAPAPIEAFKEKGEDFIVRKTLPELVQAMNSLTGDNLIDYAAFEREILARDREMDNTFSKDAQVMALRNARTYRGDKLIRVATPHKILDPAAGPLIAVRLHTLTRKTLGGLETDLKSRVLQSNGEPLQGLYAAGEAAGFGGGGYHGYRALEGTFLGGCIFSGRAAGRAAAER